MSSQEQKMRKRIMRACAADVAGDPKITFMEDVEERILAALNEACQAADSALAERDAEVERLRKLANRGYDVEVLFHQYKAEKVRSDVKLEADRDRLKAENERLEAEAQDAESVRAAALDEAARVCELYRVDPPAIVREALPHIDYEAFNTCLERSADAIRARKGGAW